MFIPHINECMEMKIRAKPIVLMSDFFQYVQAVFAYNCKHFIILSISNVYWSLFCLHSFQVMTLYTQSVCVYAYRFLLKQLHFEWTVSKRNMSRCVSDPFPYCTFHTELDLVNNKILKTGIIPEIWLRITFTTLPRMEHCTACID